MGVYASGVKAQSPVTAYVDTKQMIAEVPADFMGLSFETEKMLTDKTGGHFFSSENHGLIALIKLLGIKNIRIGGNTADRQTVPIPTHTDIDYLFGFAKSAGVKIIYTLRLKEGNADNAAETAAYIMRRYASELSCFAIGNEPNVFAKEYPAYRDEWKRYVDRITEPQNASEAMFCGPCSTPGKAEWCREFASDFGNSGRIKFIAQHAYPGGNGMKVQDQSAARRAMLSSSWEESYQAFYDSFVPAVRAQGLTYRIEETNNFYNGGAPDVSDTFASALWGLDYLYWWAAHGAIGLNFHTGDSVAAGGGTNPCRYAVFWTSPKGYTVHPLGYAIKAFDLGCHGSIVPVRLISNSDSVQVSVYGVASGDKSLYITIINRESGPQARSAIVTIASRDPFRKGSTIFLEAPHGDIAAKSGIMLGGAQINEDETWSGRWTPLEKSDGKNDFAVTVPGATAAVVKITVR